MKNSYTLDNYNDLFFKYKFGISGWKLELHDDFIKIKNKKIETKTISNLVFEVNGETYPRNPYGPTLCVSHVYLKLKNKENPKLLLTIRVEEKYILANDSEAFRVTSNLVEIIGKKYNIPYNYSLGVDTKEKKIGLILIAIIIPLFWIILYMTK